MTTAHDTEALNLATAQTRTHRIQVLTDVSRFETSARERILARQCESPPLSTSVTEVPTIDDTTSTIFEYDITGARVRQFGQATGGFVREVVENESALVYAVQDPVSLYILERIAANDDSIAMGLLDEMIANHRGWICFGMLLRSGLVDIVGPDVRLTSRGKRELQTVLDYCSAAEVEDSRAHI